MRARITRTIVGVTALVVVMLGVPFAIVIERFYENRATVELQRSAAETIAELAIPLQADEIADAAREPDAPPDFSVYDAAGDKLFGSGPDSVDGATGGLLVVVSPITDRTTENVIGSVRVSRERSSIDGDTRRAWGLMVLAAIGGLVVALFVARREAERLAAPILDLAARAERLGSGEPDPAPAVTGTPELDVLANALSVSGRRLEELVTREREFSANASHQLRTPLAGLQLTLERGDIAGATAEARRLSATVDHMLALSRDSLPTPDVIDVGQIVTEVASRWSPTYRDAGRELVPAIDHGLTGARVRRGSLEQALDVLLDNSLRHGDGQTSLKVRSALGGLVVQVADEGPGIEISRSDAVFARYEGSGTGIGLALARTLVEADGGRLLLTDPDHAEFQIIVTSAAPPALSGNPVSSRP